MTALIVCGLDRVDEVIAARAPSHLVTLLDPASLGATPAGIGEGRHLRLGINDIAEPTEGLTCPTAATVDEILAFGRHVGRGGADPDPLLGGGQPFHRHRLHPGVRAQSGNARARDRRSAARRPRPPRTPIR